MAKKTISSRTTARLIAQAADKIKAIDLVILDLRKLASFADYFVIASGNSTRQVEAIADSIIEELGKKELKPIGVEGLGNAKWALIDYGDAIAHIFHHPVREFYAIEKLWGDARRIKVIHTRK